MQLLDSHLRVQLELGPTQIHINLTLNSIYKAAQNVSGFFGFGVMGKEG